MVPVQREMNLAHEVLEVLVLQVSQYLHGCSLDLFYVANRGSAAVVDGYDAVHELVPALVVLLLDSLDRLGDFEDAVVDDLDAVVEVGKLVLLRADIACQDVFEHLWDVVLRGGGAVVLLCLVLLVRLLLVTLLDSTILLLLVVLLGVDVVLLLQVGLFARV